MQTKKNDLHKQIDDAYNFVSNIDILLKSRRNIENDYSQYRILLEEKCLNELLLTISNLQNNCLLIFDSFIDKQFYAEYNALNIFLNKINYVERTENIIVKSNNNYIFNKNIFPKELKDYYEKNDNIKQIINLISKIDYSKFSTIIYNNLKNSYLKGGSFGFDQLDIPIEFHVDNIDKIINDISNKLSTGIISTISTRIENTFLEGVKLGENIKELRQRINDAWNKLINIEILSKNNNDEIIMPGYEYGVDVRNLANIISRMEVYKYFIKGQLESYRQMGNIDKVKFVLSDGESNCPICSIMSDELLLLKDANNLIPLHSKCHCSYYPVLNSDFYSESNLAINNVKILYEINGS